MLVERKRLWHEQERIRERDQLKELEKSNYVGSEELRALKKQKAQE